MSRSDRLYRLVTLLRDGRLHRGRDLARRLGVSLRTIYRDIDRLQDAGLPVEGERGIGYMMSAPITLPPLNLTLPELEALHYGLARAAEAPDRNVARAARSLAARIDATLPEDRAAPAEGRGVAMHPFPEAARGFVHMAPIRAAIRSRRRLRLVYADPGGPEERLTARPLQMEYWGRIWTLTAWCEEDAAFRVLRVDRIQTLDVTFESFEDEPGKRLTDWLDRDA